jgi:DNA-binding NtrC family response regulator
MKPDIPRNILIVDDDGDVLYTAKLALKRLFDRVDTIDSPVLIPEYLKKCRYDVILLDMNYTRGNTSGEEGLEWLGKIHQIDPDIKVLMTTAYGEINMAVQTMKMGASDFIIKPWNQESLVNAINNASCPASGKKELNKKKNNNTNASNHSEINYQEIICRSQVMVHVMDTIRTVAPTDANVLILGENGTGKELAAWALHVNSFRNQKPFVHVDLASIPETLFESELFGHTRGAFTDAREERTGRFEAASGGTLFLDEIGNLSMPLQAKILTAIQNKAIVRIGSNHQVPVDVRLISATNMPLVQLADSFNFRQDLLYRINTVEITLPPLRERGEDIDLIAQYYLKLYSEHYGKDGLVLRDDTYLKLDSYPWPGNIRELAHAIERAVILSKGKILTPDDFVLKIRNLPVQNFDENVNRVEDYEKKAISSALDKHKGNLSRAAEDLGIARSTLYRKIAHFGIDNLSQAN